MVRPPRPTTRAVHGDLHDGNREMLSAGQAMTRPMCASSPPIEGTAVSAAPAERLPAHRMRASTGRSPHPASRRGSPGRDQLRRRPDRTVPIRRSSARSPRGHEPTAQPMGATRRRSPPRRQLRYRGSCGVGLYNRERPHLGYRNQSRRPWETVELFVRMEVVHPGLRWKVVAATHATPARSRRMDVHQNAKNHAQRSTPDGPAPG